MRIGGRFTGLQGEAERQCEVGIVLIQKAHCDPFDQASEEDHLRLYPSWTNGRSSPP